LTRTKNVSILPFEIMFDITPEDTESEDLTLPAGLPYKGMEQPDSNSSGGDKGSKGIAV
jgi:hypothetical protein